MVVLALNLDADAVYMYTWVVVRDSHIPHRILVLASYSLILVANRPLHLGIALGIGCLHCGERCVEVHEEESHPLEMEPGRWECLWWPSRDMRIQVKESFSDCRSLLSSFLSSVQMSGWRFKY